MVVRKHSRIDLSLLQHQSTSEEKHERLLKRGSGELFSCRPRYFVLAVSSKIKVMCHLCTVKTEVCMAHYWCAYRDEYKCVLHTIFVSICTPHVCHAHRSFYSVHIHCHLQCFPWSA